MVAQHDQHNCVCLLFGLRRTADRWFASCRGAPFDGVGAADWLARLDFSFGLVPPKRAALSSALGGSILGSEVRANYSKAN